MAHTRIGSHPGLTTSHNSPLNALSLALFWDPLQWWSPPTGMPFSGLASPATLLECTW